MEYKKPALSIKQQIEKLKLRGLIIANEEKAAHYLSNISFYRLRAYTYPFQDNLNPEHPFVRKISFEDIIALYVFDRKLRLLILDAIEKIEVAFRTQIIYQYSIKHGSHWHLDEHLFRNIKWFYEHQDLIHKELDRNNEQFIEHYFNKYTSPESPPCWMTLEVISIGLLSKFFQNAKRGHTPKDTITNYFGLKDTSILENWMQCFTDLRNTCAHHSRVWNRRYKAIKYPSNPINKFPQTQNTYPNKIYPLLCAMEYILKIISPENTLKQKLPKLMESCPLQQIKEMGFPADWLNQAFWSTPPPHTSPTTA